MSEVPSSLPGTNGIENRFLASVTDTMFFSTALWKPFDPPTIALQTATGLGLAAAVFLPASQGRQHQEGLGMAIDLGVRSLLAAIAIPIGIYYSGKMLNGNGSYIWTLLGTLGGSGLAVLPNIISGSGGSELVPGVVVGAVVGGIIGYQLSASTIYETSPERSPEIPVKAKPETPLHVQSPTTYIEITLNDGDVKRGSLTDIAQDGISILAGEETAQIPHSQIKKISIPGRSVAGKRILYGALLGGYASMYAFGGVYTPNPYFLRTHTAESLGRIFFSVLPGAAFGAGVGYLFDLFASKDEEIEFGAGKELRTQGFGRLQSIANSTSTESKIHLTVQGGNVFTNGDQNHSIPGQDRPSRDASNFNWMRKMEISYSLETGFEMGLSKVVFSEPFAFDTRYTASGYYLMGHYVPGFVSDFNDRFYVSVGAGVGTSDVSYTRWGHYLYPDGTWSLTDESVGFSESLFTGIMTAEAGFRIYDAMSLGIMVDHVFAPSRDVPGWTAVGIEPTSLNLGNTSAGFSLSVRF
ncbi:MAG: hypothetical protein WBD36_06095 [Bacteroidota bacterium]